MCGCIRADSNNSLHSEASHIEDMCVVVGSGRSFSPHSRPVLN